jgi:hexosaminidase
MGYKHRCADSMDKESQHLIPPTLAQFAQTFREGLNSSLGLKLLSIAHSIQNRRNSVFLTLDQLNCTFVGAAGRPTSEGYSLLVDSDGITIAGASPLGTAALNKLNIAQGSGIDALGCANRGFMMSAKGQIIRTR